jgi:hypothetical protein
MKMDLRSQRSEPRGGRVVACVCGSCGKGFVDCCRFRFCNECLDSELRKLIDKHGRPDYSAKGPNYSAKGRL